MPDKASNPERTKDGANVPENRKWSDQDHRWEYEAQGLLEPEKLADGQDGPEDQAQTIAALTQEVATLKAERDMLRNANAVMFNGVTVKLRKHGDDGKHCWLTPTALYAEIEYLQAALATLRSENERLRWHEITPENLPVHPAEIMNSKAEVRSLHYWTDPDGDPTEPTELAEAFACDNWIFWRPLNYPTPPAPGPTSTEEKADGNSE